MKAALGKTIAIAMISAPLGACTSFLGIPLAKAGPNVRPAAQTVDSTVAGVGTTDAGRAELTAGNPGTAVEMFRRALAQGEPTAPALNGLAIAYARLGRDDLALRYFQEAVAADPANGRYSLNLAKLMQSSRAFASGLAIEEKRRTRETAEAPPVAVAGATGALLRISRSEVRILTTDPAAGASAQQNRAYPGFKPLIRVEIANQVAVPVKRSESEISDRSRPAARIAAAKAPAQPRRFVRIELPNPR